jgi:predicted nucleic acid-binding protein
MKRDVHLLEMLKGHRPGNIVTAPPVVAEIHYGTERLDKLSRKYALLIKEKDRWLSVIRVMPWTSEASQSFGKIKANLEQRGQLIDDFDIAIAAIAQAHDCGVMTANLRHFKRVKNLKTVSWISGR